MVSAFIINGGRVAANEKAIAEISAYGLHQERSTQGAEIYHFDALPKHTGQQKQFGELFQLF